jgi:hypothetical protein
MSSPDCRTDGMRDVDCVYVHRKPGGNYLGTYGWAALLSTDPEGGSVSTHPLRPAYHSLKQTK